MAATLTLPPLSLQCSGKNSDNSSSFRSVNFKRTLKCPKLTFPPPSRRSVTKPITKAKKTVVAALPNITNFVCKLMNALNHLETLYNKYGWILKLITQSAKAGRELLTMVELLKKFLKKVGEILGKLITKLGGLQKKEEEIDVRDAKGDKVEE